MNIQNERCKSLVVAACKVVACVAVLLILPLLVGCKTTQPLSHSTDSITTEQFDGESFSGSSLTVTTGVVSASIDSSHTLTTWYDTLGRPVKTENRRDWHHGTQDMKQTATQNDSTINHTQSTKHSETHDKQEFVKQETWWQRAWRNIKTYSTTFTILAILLALLNFDRIVTYIKRKTSRSIFD